MIATSSLGIIGPLGGIGSEAPGVIAKTKGAVDGVPFRLGEVNALVVLGIEKSRSALAFLLSFE